MWDNPALMRSVSNALLAFSTFALLYGAISYAVHLPGLFPLHSVQMRAAPQRVMTEDLLQVMRSEVDGNLFTVDIERLRLALEKLPWVRSVSIRREFPARLVVALEEHQALARWQGLARFDSAAGSGQALSRIGLVNTHGEVFDASSAEPLPEFISQESDSFEVAQRYEEFSGQLAVLNLRIAQLALTPRHAWRVILDNGVTLELGREQMQLRMARFVAMFPYTEGRGQQTEDRGHGTEGRGWAHVDLRYRNGLAIRQMAKGRKLWNEG